MTTENDRDIFSMIEKIYDLHNVDYDTGKFLINENNLFESQIYLPVYYRDYLPRRSNIEIMKATYRKNIKKLSYLNEKIPKNQN